MISIGGEDGGHGIINPYPPGISGSGCEELKTFSVNDGSGTTV